MGNATDLPSDRGTPIVPHAGRWQWSPALDTALIEAYRSGMTLAQLSSEFDRPSGAIDLRVRALRGSGVELPVRKPRWTDADKQRLVERYKAGASRNELAAEFGKAKGTINRQLSALKGAGVDLTRQRQSINQHDRRRKPSGARADRG